jgi:hypothetical protein
MDSKFKDSKTQCSYGELEVFLGGDLEVFFNVGENLSRSQDVRL